MTWILPGYAHTQHKHTCSNMYFKFMHAWCYSDKHRVSSLKARHLNKALWTSGGMVIMYLTDTGQNGNRDHTRQTSVLLLSQYSLRDKKWLGPAISPSWLYISYHDLFPTLATHTKWCNNTNCMIMSVNLYSRDYIIIPFSQSILTFESPLYLLTGTYYKPVTKNMSKHLHYRKVLQY